MPVSNEDFQDYAAEVARLRNAGVAGQSGRLRDLFDYFAERGPDAHPPTQAEIAQAVFGQSESDADDATVRVYVHRLRKKLDDHYLAHRPAADQSVLEIPAGVYVLRPVAVAELEVLPIQVSNLHSATGESRKGAMRYWPVLAGLALVAAFLAGIAINRGLSASSNAIWQPLAESDRPVLIVLGDYYLFGEIDPVRPDEGRLIRDFRVDSAEDLLRMQEANPDRYGYAEDVGLNYLPFQSAYALQEVVPLLARQGKQVEVIAGSQLTSNMLNDYDVVYLGLLSGMGLLEDVTFSGSSLRIGDTYDEIIDRESGQRWISDEARRLASPAFYRDYAYVARYLAPGGAQVIAIASERVTGLRGIGPVVTAADLPETVSDAARNGYFEALFLVTGQQGADLSDRIIMAKSRD